ncbi:hypothetical protein JZ751_029394 [Albula glossodonta]|uniref:Uncharacterized protein n=1 Tax=Albula glossodonta TaxID=121402 RepID=A0A8T2P954_9TELE|nr:hypothetical protein JZ751_029394 [Albula glossodonta]
MFLPPSPPVPDPPPPPPTADFDPGLGMMTGIAPMNPMMPGLGIVPPPISQDMPIVKEIIHCKSCTLFPPNPTNSQLPWALLHFSLACPLEQKKPLTVHPRSQPIEIASALISFSAALFMH